jgi:glycosyl transferase family 25
VSQGKLGRYTLNAYIGPFTGNATYLLKKDVAKRLLPGL